MKTIKTKKANKSNKIIIKKIIISLSILIILILSFAILEWTGMTNFTNNPKIQNPEQIQQNEDNTKLKEDLIKKQPNTSDSPTVIKPTSEDITISSTESGDNVIISIQLKNYSDGECNLLITNGSSNYSRSVPVIYQPSFSTCAGFSVAKSELGTGTWSISLSVVSNSQTNNSSSTIEVN